MNENLLTESDLKSWFDYENRSALIRKLDEYGVSYWHGKGGQVVTTLQAINYALLKKEGEEIEFQ